MNRDLVHIEMKQYRPSKRLVQNVIEIVGDELYFSIGEHCITLFTSKLKVLEKIKHQATFLETEDSLLAQPINAYGKSLVLDANNILWEVCATGLSKFAEIDIGSQIFSHMERLYTVKNGIVGHIDVEGADHRTASTLKGCVFTWLQRAYVLDYDTKTLTALNADCEASMTEWVKLQDTTVKLTDVRMLGGVMFAQTLTNQRSNLLLVDLCTMKEYNIALQQPLCLELGKDLQLFTGCVTLSRAIIQRTIGLGYFQALQTAWYAAQFETKRWITFPREMHRHLIVKYQKKLPKAKAALALASLAKAELAPVKYARTLLTNDMGNCIALGAGLLACFWDNRLIFINEKAQILEECFINYPFSQRLFHTNVEERQYPPTFFWPVSDG